jgi:pimeloyl-ACP methyl ester carboxylesterase
MASPAVRRSLAGLALAALLAASALAEEVTTRHRGLTLNANLELAQGKGLEDGVVLITHGLLAHNKMELIAALQGLLKARGWSTLAINLSLGVNDRHGFFDCGRLHTHRPTDALDEIDAWIGWLKTQGATDIVLMGHSQGGAHTALYAAERKDEAVSAVVLLAPATFSHDRNPIRSRWLSPRPSRTRLCARSRMDASAAPWRC